MLRSRTSLLVVHRSSIDIARCSPPRSDRLFVFDLAPVLRSRASLQCFVRINRSSLIIDLDLVLVVCSLRIIFVPIDLAPVLRSFRSDASLLCFALVLRSRASLSCTRGSFDRPPVLVPLKISRSLF